MNYFEKVVIFFVVVAILSGVFTVGVFAFNKEAFVIKLDEVFGLYEKREDVFPDIQNLTEKVSEEFTLNKNQTNNFKFLRPLEEQRDLFVENKVSFIEINQPTKKINYFKDGKLELSKNILAAGDPQGWGGTPAGLYKVLAKNKNAYSRSAEAYMPHAVQFYGKYYIHGEPFNRLGQKLVSSVSGGCIRVVDSEMTHIFNLASQGLPILVVDEEYGEVNYNNLTLGNLRGVSADSYAVVDLSSGAILAEKNSTTTKPIASITKLMTALVVAEHVDLRKGIFAESDMLEAYGSTLGLVSGGYYRVVELFYPLLTESSNDAAEVLAGFLGKERTIQLMNDKARSLFMENTQFDDTSGFSEANVSSALDLTLLARYIVNNRGPIFDITRGKNVVTFGSVQFPLVNLRNKNAFMGREGFLGGKSGYLESSKNTGLFVFEFINAKGEKVPVAISILGSEALKNDAEVILSWLNREYKLALRR